MKVTTKVIILSWCILFIVLASLVFSAYTKLKPESLISLLNTQIQRSYPGSDLKIDKIDYMFSVDFKLSLKGLTLTREQKVIAGADEVQLKVPWWLILFNRGNASINISDLNIYVTSISTNPVNNETNAQTIKNNKVEIILPEYLVDAHYTVRAKNISIKELDGDRRYFTLTKLLVREFQYGKNSAFELNIPINITHKNKRYASDLWLFGDLTPDAKVWLINYRGEFKTKEAAEGSQYEDLVIDGKSTLIPSSVDLYSTIQLMIEKKKVGTGEIKAQYDKLQVNLKFTQFPMNYLKMIGEEITNPFWSKMEGTGEGEVKFVKYFAKEHASSLSAKVHFPGMFELGSDQKISGQWFLDLKNDIIQTSFISPKQELKFSRRAVLDFDKNQVVQYSQEIGFNDCDLKTALLSVQSLSGLMDPVAQPFHSTVVLLKHCIDDEKIFDGFFRLGILPHQKYYLGELQNEQSKLSLKYSSKESRQEFELELHNFSWKPAYVFMAPYFSASNGVLHGKVEGKWISHWSDGSWLMNLKADNLKDATGEFLDLNQKLWNYFSLDGDIFVNKSWNANVKNKSIKLNSLVLESSDPAHMSGSLSTRYKDKSFLSINYPKNKKWKLVKKDVTEVFWQKDTQ